MVLNYARGPVRKYYDLLLRSKVLKNTDDVLIECDEDVLKNFKGEEVIILQQGKALWPIDDISILNKIKFIITSSLIVSKFLEKRKKTFLLEFPIEDYFCKNKNYNDRESALYFHGRVISSKLPISDLGCLLRAGIKIVIRGPVCFEYWSQNKMTDEASIKYERELMDLSSKYSNLVLLGESHEKDVIVSDLNSYKFYFTLSTCEAFNLALQEAIACGAIPFVRNNGAYWWAHECYVGFEQVGELINLYGKYYNKDLKEYSSVISEEIQKRCSIDAIHKKFLEQQK